MEVHRPVAEPKTTSDVIGWHSGLRFCDWLAKTRTLSWLVDWLAKSRTFSPTSNIAQFLFSLARRNKFAIVGWSFLILPKRTKTKCLPFHAIAFDLWARFVPVFDIPLTKTILYKLLFLEFVITLFWCSFFGISNTNDPSLDFRRQNDILF